jgi:hypothetical protein
MSRRFFARIQHGLKAIRLPMQQIEPAAAQTRTTGLDHRQCRGHRHRRIECVAAIFENFLARFAGERIGAGDRALVRNGRMRGGGRRRGCSAVGVRRRRNCQQQCGGKQRSGQERPQGFKYPPGASSVCRVQSLRCRFSSISTMGCTNSDTLPPSTAISRTNVEEMKVYCSCGVMNTDSISGVRCRLILAN